MRAARRKAVDAARGARHWGVVLGTLGRQGNPALVRRLQQALADAGRTTTLFLVSELSPQRLAMVQGVDAWVQVRTRTLSAGAHPQPPNVQRLTHLATVTPRTAAQRRDDARLHACSRWRTMVCLCAVLRACCAAGGVPPAVD